MTAPTRPWFWLAVYLVLVSTPLVVLILAPVPAKGGFWWEAGIALGFAGLIMMSLQFALTGRLRFATAPFGIDVIYYFHRFLAYALLLIVLAHPVFLLLDNPGLLDDLHPDRISWPIFSGVASLGLLLLLVISSAFRKTIRLPYNRWLRIHLLLALAAVASGFAHMWAIGYYSATPSLQWLWGLIALSVLAATVHVRLVRPWLMTRKPWKIRELTPAQGESWTVDLAPEDHAGLDFQPGQFAWITVDASPFAMREHPFSLSSAPRADGSVEFTIKELGDFTNRIGQFPVGTTVYVDGPYGVFSMDRHPQAPGYVFIAGGIGVAPVLGMIRALAERGDQRPHLLFGAHSQWDRVPRRDELSALASRLNLTSVPVLEDPPPGWTGEQGWMTREMLERHLPENYREMQYFICGPQAMTKAVEGFLHELGVPMRRIHTELFDMA